jgi:predicted AlkP superfamily pyrophosphatase or phosphodiesterase
MPPLAGKSTLFVVSDHGFAPYDKIMRPNVVLKEMGLITTEGDKVTDRKAWCVAQGGSAFIYILDEARREELIPQLKQKLGALEGVRSIVEPPDFYRFGFPSPDNNPEAPHLLLTTGRGYSFAEVLTAPAIAPTDGLKGSHGHDPNPAYMHATFIAAGAGIKPGVKLDLMNNTDIAPTIAHLLGIELKDVDGRVLDEILAK